MKKKYADMDPIEEIRAVRAELSRKFPTTKALFDHLRQHYPVTNPAPELPQKNRRTSAKAKANARPALRQRKSTVST
jgi:hypothetical protein